MNPTPGSDDGRTAPAAREPMRDSNGAWTREWFCTPPPAGTPFRVLQGEWLMDFTLQRIYEIELPGD